MKTPRQKQVDKLDKLFSQYIRKKAIKLVGGCQRCLTPKKSYKELQCIHFHSRRKMTVRFHENNAIGGCGACHLYLHGNPHDAVTFWQKHLGDEYDRLYILAQMTTKQSPIDMAMVEVYLKELLKEVT